MTEAEALKRFIPILGRISTPYERATIVMRVNERINDSQRTSLLGVTRRHVAALAWPSDPVQAKQFEDKLNAAADAGDFVSLISDGKHLQIEELLAWPDCPAISPDSPLTFWLGEPATATDTVTPAPTAESPSNAPVDGITTAQVATFFDGLPFTAENWPKRLSDTKWLKRAQVALGAAGGATSLWNPATLARLIHSKEKGTAKQKTLEALNRKFKGNPVLEPWRTDWNEHYEMFNDAAESH